MTGKESGHIDHEAAQAVPHTADPDALELAPGTVHEKLEGWIPQLATDEEIRIALEKAFDYRGDVTITRKDGSKIEGYLFDRRTAATLKDSVVRLFPKTANEKIRRKESRRRNQHRPRARAPGLTLLANLRISCHSERRRRARDGKSRNLPDSCHSDARAQRDRRNLLFPIVP